MKNETKAIFEALEWLTEEANKLLTKPYRSDSDYLRAMTMLDIEEKVLSILNENSKEE